MKGNETTIANNLRYTDFAGLVTYVLCKAELSVCQFLSRSCGDVNSDSTTEHKILSLTQLLLIEPRPLGHG